MTVVDDAPKVNPAKFSAAVMKAVIPWLDREATARFEDPKNGTLRIIDVFAGSGKVHEIHEETGDFTVGVELEPEWIEYPQRMVVANSLNPPFRKRSFHVLFTSPAYGNRFADSYDGRDGSTRRTYRIHLGRPLSPDSGAGQQWGDEYRRLHRSVLVRTLPMLDDGALVIVNMSNHLRKLKQGDYPQLEMHVVEWWVMMLASLGLRLLAIEPVETPRYGFGANQQAKADTEFLLVFRVPFDREERRVARNALGLKLEQGRLL